MNMIIFSDKWEEEKINNDELIREIITYMVGNERADMMAVIEHDGFVRAYNMDGNHYYYDELTEPENYLEKEIPKDILERLVEMAEMQIKIDYEKMEKCLKLN